MSKIEPGTDAMAGNQGIPPQQPQMMQPPPMMPVYQQPQPMMAQQQSSTTVVINQQNAGPVVQPLRDWSSGLCGCFEDMSSCFLVWCCPEYHPCILSSRMGESCCLPWCMPGGTWLIALRTKLRAEENIEGSIMGDCCAVHFCGPCVECQMERELDYIGGRRAMLRQ